MERLFTIAGVIIFAGSCFFVVAALGDLITPDLERNTKPGVLWGLLIFFSISAAAGAYLIYNNLQRLRRNREERREHELLTVIARHNGRVTSMEVAMDTSMTLAEAEQALRKLSHAGQGDLKLTAEGHLVYVFHGVASAADKAAAKSALEL